MIDSIWSKKVPPRYPPLAGDIQAEAAVIGGGMAGVLTARLLQEAGVDTVLLEAERIGGGQTSGTTAKVTAQHGDKYRQLLASLGAETAGQYAAAQRQAVEDYEALIRRAGIRCGWERRSSWLTAGEEAPLREELEACRTLGLPVKFLPDPQLPFPAAGAVELPEQGQFHPLEFLYGAAQGLRIYEKSRVLQAEENLLHTRQGSVSCRYVVFADHYPFPKTPGYYFLRLHQERSYILALEGAKIPPAMVYHLEPAGKVLYLRPWGEGLLLGGEGHLTGEGREGGRYAALEQRAKELFPGCRVVKRWSAQDCIPLDGLPYIGAFSPARPGWFVATGFGKWGMTGSMAAARMLRGLLTGLPEPWSGVFSPQRFHLSASAQTLAENSLQAAKGLGRRFLTPPRGIAEHLPKGHGGIVEAEGEKLGVYRDEAGEVFLVEARCPHLGCQLEWNPDEKSWDCPCHGSRFDYRGRLLTGPAQEGLPTPPQGA